MVQTRVKEYRTKREIEERLEELAVLYDIIGEEMVEMENRLDYITKPGFKIPYGGFKDVKQTKKAGKNCSKGQTTQQKAAKSTEKEKITRNIKNNSKKA
jgi:hypothetical protein